MATVTKRNVAIIIFLVGICICGYIFIFESSIFDLLEMQLNGDQSNIISFASLLSFNDTDKDDYNETVNISISESFYLNSHLFGLSSIDRTKISSLQWTNPSIITHNTVVIGFCCENPKIHDCILQKYSLVFSMALFNSSSTNLYFQRCEQNGLYSENYAKVISIKDRRDILLNANNTATWDVNDEEKLWFQPDLYLCQGYFWDDTIINTRREQKDFVELKPEQIAHLNKSTVVVGKTMKHPSHRLSTYRPFLITTNTEFWGGYKCTRYDVVFDTNIGRVNDGCFAIHSPPAFWYEFMRINNHTAQLILPKSDDEKQKYLNHVLNIKNRALFHTLFLVKYCFKLGRYPSDVVARVLFFDMLKERFSNQSIDALGKCREDKEARKKLKFVQRGLDYTYGYQGVRDGVVEMAMKYKFMITFENSRSKGYMTEKFMNAMYGYAIPIYFGDDMIPTYFNERRFINCNISDEHAHILYRLINKNERSVPAIPNTEGQLMQQVNEIIGDRLKECVEKVVEIDQDDEKYKQMLLEPLFKNNQYEGSILDPFVMAGRLKEVLRSVDSYLLMTEDND